MTTENQQQNVMKLSVVNAVVAAYDEAFVRTAIAVKLNKELKTLDTFSALSSHYISKQMFNFFVPESLENLREWIFSNEELRDLIFSVMQKTRFIIFTESDKGGGDIWGDYIADVSRAVGYESLYGSTDGHMVDSIMVPKPVIQSLAVWQLDLQDILKTNPHLLILFTLLQNYEKTAHYMSIVEAVTKEPTKQRAPV